LILEYEDVPRMCVNLLFCETGITVVLIDNKISDTIYSKRHNNKFQMKKATLILIAGTGLVISSCQNSSHTDANDISDSERVVTSNTDTAKALEKLMYGTWVQPNPINEKEVQGFKLNKDSSAESINMATLIYRYWWINDQHLYLIRESKGNKQTITDTIIFPVLHVTDQELILKDRDRTVSYKKL